MVQVDLCKSSELMREVQRLLKQEGIVLLHKQILETVKKAFDSVRENTSDGEAFKYSSNGEVFKYNSNGGFIKLEKSPIPMGFDGYRIFLKDIDKTWKFVESLAEDVQTYNDDPDIKKRVFRIAAIHITSENMDYNESREGIDKFLGYPLVTLSRLCQGATAGWIYVDEETREYLPYPEPRERFTEVKVNPGEQDKPHDGEIHAWGLQVISDISAYTEKSNKQQILIEIRNLLKKVKRMSQIQDIENSINMNLLICLSKKNNITIEQAQVDILTYIREENNGERDSEVKRLINVRDMIQKIIN
ncbi:MAG: hypothetical protein AAFX80_16845 [Cyanobacteria bacterium J06639_18]